jgi:hypothetical protein
VCINDAVSHFIAEDLPFGGVGESGMGHYHGYEGFLDLLAPEGGIPAAAAEYRQGAVRAARRLAAAPAVSPVPALRASRSVDEQQAEIRRLRDLLAVVRGEARENEAIFRRSHERYLRLLQAGSLGELFDAIVNGLRRDCELDAVTLVVQRPAPRDPPAAACRGPARGTP